MRAGNAKRAFTLIELLVVIAIISLLVSILLPSLNRAKDLARSVTCLSNLRNSGMGIILYAQDNDGQLIWQYWLTNDAQPQKFESAATPPWNAMGFLLPGGYLGVRLQPGELTLDTKPDLQRCPADTGARVFDTRRDWSSYVYQSPHYTSGGATHPDQPNTLAAANPGWALMYDVSQLFHNWGAPHSGGTTNVWYAGGHAASKDYIPTPAEVFHAWPKIFDESDPR
jgi:prepilin-type N-terminal cleavage/methylation domain-containing protein/prepilin-type processing-associated H-X9-DG protein